MFDIYNSSANFSDDCMISLAPVDSFVEYANYYLSRSKNELYCALGNSLLSNLSSVQRSDKISVNPFDTSNLISYKKGKTYLKSIQSKISYFVCKEWKFCEKIKLYKSEIDFVVDLSYVLASKISGVPTFAVSVLLVKQGATEFCNCQE